MARSLLGFQGIGRDRGEFPLPPVVFFDDFLTGGFAKDDELTNESDPAGKFSEVANRGDWLVTQTTTGQIEAVAIQDDADGGHVQIISDTDDGDHVCCQLNGEPFLLKEGRRLEWECRVKFTSTADHALLGLAVSTTDPITTTPSDYIAFAINGDADLECVSDAGSAGTSVTDTDEDVATDTFVVLAFVYDGEDTIDFLVNGEQVHVTATTVPKDAYLSPFFAVESNGTTAGQVVVDYVQVINER